MRPVTLSRAANTAIWFLMISACAPSDASPEAMAHKAKTRRPLPATPRSLSNRKVMPHTLANGVPVLLDLKRLELGIGVAAPLRFPARRKTAA